MKMINCQTGPSNGVPTWSFDEKNACSASGLKSRTRGIDSLPAVLRENLKTHVLRFQELDCRVGDKISARSDNIVSLLCVCEEVNCAKAILVDRKSNHRRHREPPSAKSYGIVLA